MNLPVEIPDLPDLSQRYALVIAFQSSRAADYPIALSLARRASYFVEVTKGGVDYHVAAFEPTAADIARAVSIADMLTKVKGTFFSVRGRLFKDDGNVRQVLHCLNESFRVKDYRSHCHVIFPTQFPVGIPQVHVKIPHLKAKEMLIIPCALAAKYTGWALTREHPGTLQDQFRDVCVTRGCDWCPRCNPDDLGAPQVLGGPGGEKLIS